MKEKKNEGKSKEIKKEKTLELEIVDDSSKSNYKNPNTKVPIDSPIKPVESR